MSDGKDNFRASDSRSRSSLICQPLLKTATPDIFRVNAFRITGLRVDSTIREITKHADKLKMMEELGQGHSANTGAFSLPNPPTVDQIREASQRLKDSEQRIIDEFFWFWPRQFGESGSDPALRALEAGDSDTAFKIWTTLETSPTDGVVAMHNIAVLWHLMALEWESYYSERTWTEEKKQETERFWRSAFKRWELLAVDDLLWDHVTQRIKQLDDPRLTTGFARRMRATFPDALDKINAELACRYAENGHVDRAKVHVEFMRETNQGLDDVDKTAELVLAPATTRLKAQIQRAQQRGGEIPSDGANAAQELLEHARRTFALFELFFGKESDLRNDLSDETAACCNRLQVIYHKATGDNSGCLELLRAVLPFAVSIELRLQIEENLATLTGNLTYKQFEPVYVILQAIQESKEPPSVRLKKFQIEAVPAISNCSPGIVASETHTDLLNSAAALLRGISLAAWNDHQDMATAAAANGLAVKYAGDATLREQVIADQVTLRDLAMKQSAQQKSSSQGGAGCLVVLGIIGVFVLIGSFGSNKSSSSSSSTSYRVPVSRTAELHRDRQSVETAKTLAEESARELRSFWNELERERRFLDTRDTSAVNDYNRRVDRYNLMAEQAKEQEQTYNKMVDDYNAKLRRGGR